MYSNDRWESDWNFSQTLKPNSSRVLINWQGKRKPDLEKLTSKLDEHGKNNNKSSKDTYSLPPEKVLLDIKPLDLDDSNKNDINNSNDLIEVQKQPDQVATVNKRAPIVIKLTSVSPTTTVSNQSTNWVENDPNQVFEETTNTTSGSPATTTTPSTTTTTTTKRPSTKKAVARYPPNSIDSEELKALRPPTRTPENDLWLEQMHAITTPKPYDSKRDCGIRALSNGDRKARVVGGRNSQMGEFPWSVLIRETSLLGLLVKTKCGGVLIDLKWVLTAAHCKPGMFGSLVVMVGEYDLDPTSRYSGRGGLQANGGDMRLKPAVRKVKRMIIHRDYNPSNFDNDIALLELEAPFQMAPHVVPICLPEKEEEFVGQSAMVAGWGKLSFGGPVASVLQVARLPVIGSKQCQDMYQNSGHIKIISDSFVCAGYQNGGKDSCEGDSGGPLQVQRNDSRWVLVGTVSHGIKCAEPNLPGIYIRTSAYLPWIKAVMFHQDYNKRYGQ